MLLAHTLLRYPFLLFFRFMWRIRVVRDEKFDESQVALYAVNHRSFLDPMFVGVWMRRPLSYLARKTLWKVPVMAQFNSLMGAIPVDRNAPALDTMKNVVKCISKDGRRLLVFPEGTRTKTGRLGRLKDGPALFARRAKVPVIPVYIHRTECAWPRGWIMPRPGGSMEIRYGPPITAPAGVRGKAADEWVTKMVSKWLLQQENDLQGPPA